MALFASTPVETNGSDLLDEFEAVKADFAARASDRASVVAERLAALEAEQADLKVLQRQIDGSTTV